jgi:hypothetical protein
VASVEEALEEPTVVSAGAWMMTVLEVSSATASRLLDSTGFRRRLLAWMHKLRRPR